MRTAPCTASGSECLPTNFKSSRYETGDVVDCDTDYRYPILGQCVLFHVPARQPRQESRGGGGACAESLGGQSRIRQDHRYQQGGFRLRQGVREHGGKDGTLHGDDENQRKSNERDEWAGEF